MFANLHTYTYNNNGRETTMTENNKDIYDELLDELLGKMEKIQSNEALANVVNRGLENHGEPINHERWIEGFSAFLRDNDEIFNPLNQYEICRK